MNNIREQFEQDGYIVVKEALSKQEISHYIKELEKIDSKKKKNSWTIPDGVVQNEAFWPIIFNELILNKVKNILGEDIKFMQHNDLHYGYSSFAWHRDGINRSYNNDYPDWNETQASYKIVRCGYYLQPESNGFELGVVPGSHKMSGLVSQEAFLELDKRLSNFQNVKVKLGGRDVLKEKATWIKTKPGDCVIFDPRLIHTGGEFEAKKYSFFVAYGIDNKHFKEHYSYYRHLRYDLKYKNFSNKLAQQLKENNMYIDEKCYYEKIKGAWIPSSTFSFVANFFE